MFSVCHSHFYYPRRNKYFIEIFILRMTSFHLKNRWGILRTGQLCTEIFNDKLNKALQYAVRCSIYDPELTLKELTTAQSLLLSLLYGLLHRDIPFCLNIIEASSAAVQLRSSYIKVWFKDDFNFKQDDIAQVFSNLATLMTCKFPSQLELPPYITIAFSGLVDKYKLFDVFNSSGEKIALELIEELNNYVLEIAKNLGTTLQESAVVDNESNLSQILPEIQRLAINDEEDTASLPQCEVANESSGSTSPAPMPSSSRLEVQTNDCDNKESTSSSAEPKIEAPMKKFIWVKKDAVSSLSQSEVQTNNCDNKESTSSSALPKIKTLRKFVKVEVDVLPLPRAEDISEASSPSTINISPADATPPVIQAENEACGSSSPAPTPSSSWVNDVSESPGSCKTPVPSWYNEDRIYRCLQNAVRQNSLREIRDCLRIPGIDVNKELEFGDRLLHTAVYYGNEEAVVILLERGALPEIKNQDSISPIQLAIHLNLPSIFMALLEYIDNVNQVFDNGNTMLHEIASKGTSSNMYYALMCEPIVDLKNNDGYTALHLATKSGHLPAVKALIKAGADVNLLTKMGDTCLHIAADIGHFSILRHILPKANIHFKNPISKFTALHTAAYRNDCKCIELLLRKGINVNIRAFNGRTALHEAADLGHLDAVKLLLSWRASVNATAKYKSTPLHCAAGRGFVDVVLVLLDNGAHVNAKDGFGNTPLNLAKTNCKHLVKDILSLRRGLD